MEGGRKTLRGRGVGGLLRYGVILDMMRIFHPWPLNNMITWIRHTKYHTSQIFFLLHITSVYFSTFFQHYFNGENFRADQKVRVIVPVATSVFLLTQKIEAERAFEPTLKSLWVTSWDPVSRKISVDRNTIEKVVVGQTRVLRVIWKYRNGSY